MPLPSNSPLAPNCTLCGVALSGTMGKVSGLLAVRRSTRNPSLCDRCDAHVQDGQVTEMTVVFVDLSDFTSMTHELGPEKTHEITDAFLRRATEILVRHDASIDKYVGDAVMAFFNVPIARSDHAAQALAASEEILRSMPELSARFGRELDASIGMATGFARVGKLGSDDPRDFTAIGDVVNLASRLEGVAGRGELVCEEGALLAAGSTPPDEGSENLALKGFREGIAAYRIRPKDGATLLRRSTGSLAVPAVLQIAPDRRTKLRDLVALVVAILGAPCAGAFLFSPLLDAVGLSVIWSFPGVLAIDGFFDSGKVRVPLAAMALLSAGVNIQTVRRAQRRRPGTRATPRELRRERWLLALSGLSLAVVIFETWVHVVLYQKGFWN